MHQALPCKKIAKAINLKDNKKGATSILSLQGKVTFMLLKSYSQASDKRLIDEINRNIYTISSFVEFRFQQDSN
ncbi:MAG: hypothetical protein AAF770_00510 [Bacteroidota bacterium]